jgi:FdrA protein
VTRLLEVRPGIYRDSVSLMALSRDLASRPDVERALVAMATELNVELARDLGFEIPGAPTPGDLLVAIEARDTTAAEAARDVLEAALERHSGPGSAGAATEVAPRTVGAAVRRSPDATLALVSTPGRVAAIDAADALASGLDVMVFSDNVTLDDEVALKRLAAAAGRLVMGPDCGTAVVDGVGLGFANVVRPGPIGLVAASGTGAQHLLALLDACDVGVRHCLGVGGRDLDERVGARSTMEALDRLDAAPDVELIVVVSKPPTSRVAEVVRSHVGGLATPVLLGYLGEGRPDLTDTAREACARVGATWTTPRRWGSARAVAAHPGYLRGLFVGGTLCKEAMLVASPRLGELYSNVPLTGHKALGRDLTSDGHSFIDFGDDALTAGRPHPMIDPTLRLQRLADELADPDCAVLLLDVVLGLGAHPDPAKDLVDLIVDADKPVLVSLVGTRNDPQDTARTAHRLQEAGAIVHASNATAAREAVTLVEAAAFEGAGP